jgi:hypothetical protein
MSDYWFYIVIGGEKMENYSHWTIDELCNKLQGNRSQVTQLQDEITAIVDVLEKRMVKVKEVMYND